MSGDGLFWRMLREEYRLHAELFGGRRFLGFPLFVALLSAGGIYLLWLTGTDAGAIAAGLHGIAVFVGLQVGTLGLVGRDALRDVLDDVTLLVFSARTLPLSWQRLLATFLVKDLCYYAVFFLTPLVVGFVPVALAAGHGPASIALLWATVTATFALGAGASLTLVGAATRSKLGTLAAVGVATAIVVGLGVDPVSYTPYALYDRPGLTTAVAGLVPVVVAGVLGPLLFEPAESTTVRRADRDSFTRWQARLRDQSGLVTRPLMEVSRSSGSIWKVAFSLGILFAVTALLLDRLAVATTLEPSPGIAFGTLLGLGAFTTYNWVTQFDDPAEYLRYPVSMGAVFAGKRRAYLLLSQPVGIAYLAIAARWYPVADLAVGLVVFPLVSLYVFGLTAVVAGLAPNDLLFDTARFAVYGAGLALVAVPLLVAALAHGQFPGLAIGASVGLAALGAVVGLWLAGRAGPRWHDRLRATA